MNWILFFFSVELGIAIDGDYTPVDYDLGYTQVVYEDPFYIEFNPELELFDIITLYGTARLNMYKSKNDFIFFVPVSVTSIIGIQVEYAGFFIEMEHMCKHPIHPNGLYYLPEQNLNNDYTQISIGYDSRKGGEFIYGNKGRK